MGHLAVLASLLTLVAASPATAQVATVEFSGQPSCAKCTITMQRVFTLAAPATVEPLGRRTPIAMGSAGQFVVRAGNSRIQFFDARGQFTREFGATGDGPGEFRRILGVQFTRGDSLVVTEINLYHVFTPALKLSRTVAVGAQPIAILPQPDGSSIAEMSVKTPSAAGYPAHILSRTGEVVKSFGTSGQPTLDPRCTSCALRLYAGTQPGQVLIAPINRYGWEAWTTRGELAARFSVTGSPWFKTWSEAGDWIGGASPMPTTLDRVIAAPSGQLWAFAKSAPPGWKPHPMGPDSGVRRVGGAVLVQGREAMDRYTLALEATDMQMIVEVIDPRLRRVVASSTFPGAFTQLSWSHMARVRALDDGEYVVDVFRLTLNQP